MITPSSPLQSPPSTAITPIISTVSHPSPSPSPVPSPFYSSMQGFTLSVIITLIGYLLCTIFPPIPAWILTIPTVVLQVYACIHCHKNYQNVARWTVVVKCIYRLLGVLVYLNVFLWAIIVESRQNADTSLAPGVYPALVYSIYSLGIDFLFRPPSQVSSIIILFYKGCRVAILIEGVYLSHRSRYSPEDRRIEISGYGNHWWPMYIAAIFLLPTVVVGVAYFLYRSAIGFGEKTCSIPYFLSKSAVL
jgi:hypothetical protein